MWGIFRQKRLKCFKQQLIIWSIDHFGNQYQKSRHHVRQDAHLNTLKAYKNAFFWCDAPIFYR